jgi:hypothetical protein
MIVRRVLGEPETFTSNPARKPSSAQLSPSARVIVSGPTTVIYDVRLVRGRPAQHQCIALTRSTRNTAGDLIRRIADLDEQIRRP